MEMIFWIMEYVASFIEISMCCVFCGTFLLKDKLEDRKYLIFVYSAVGASLIIIFNKTEIFSFMNSILIILIIYVLQLLIYKRRPGLSALLIMIYVVILTAIDFMTAYFVAFLKDTDAQSLLSAQSPDRILCILLSKSLLVLIIYTFNKFMNKTFVFLQKYVVIMCIYSIFLFVSLFVMVELNMDNGNPKVQLFLTVFYSVLIAIELLMFYFVIKTGEGYEEKQRAELIEMKNSMLQKSLEETEQAFKLWRSSVHDYKNNIIALTKFANDGNLAEIKKYLERENELIDRKMFYIRTGNSVVDTIVNTKQSYAEKKGITFVVNAKVPDRCVISDLDMAGILGNLIDNAIEASVTENDPYIDVTIKKEKQFIVIRITNKYSGEFSKGFETKKRNKEFHGIGIGSVQSIVKKYDGEFLIDQSGDEVIAKILIPDFEKSK